MVLVSRIVVALLGVLGAIYAGRTFDLVGRFDSSSYAYTAFGIIIFLAFSVGWMVGWIVGKGLARGFKRVERAAQSRSAGELTVGAVGLLVGLLVSALLYLPVHALPYIGNWVLLTACKQLRLWQKRVDPDLTISVNLSARQFQQPDLLSSVSQTLDDTGIDPHFLELEITESNAMQNAENTIYTLRELKALGVRIAMDDFGTGYSSLNYLKRFPIDILKLDQSFVREVNHDATDAAIVSAVISMAHSLDLKVIAEGVETEEQLAFLTKQRCDRIQGYLFSAPLAPDQLEAYLLQRKSSIAAAR